MFDQILLAAGATGAADGTVAGLIAFISIALGFSFLCSVWEAVVLTTSLSYVEVQVDEGKRSAEIMRWIKANLEQAISAILTLNTIAHTVGAAGAGAQAAGLLGNEWLGVISAVLTFLILVFSEIIPKTLGAVYWKQLMPFTAYGVRGLIILLYPAVKAFHYLSRLITPSEKEPTITRLELEALAEIGEDEGALAKEEHLILSNLFKLDQVTVGDIMTPRTVVFMLPESMTVGEVTSNHPLLAHSRIPLFKENHDDVIGFVLRHQILSTAAEDKHDTPLKELVLPIQAIPESVSVAKALQEFISLRDHILLVLDEYGGTAGIITMEDAIESLLGIEIVDESDIIEDMRQLAKARYERQLRMTAQLKRPPTDSSTTSTAPSTPST